MSHRIIIGSSRKSAAMPTTADDQPTSIDINITYMPSHHESDKVSLRRVAKIMRLMRQMEEVIDSSDDESES